LETDDVKAQDSAAHSSPQKVKADRSRAALKKLLASGHGSSRPRPKRVFFTSSSACNQTDDLKFRKRRVRSQIQMQLVSAAADGENHAIIPHLGFGLNVHDRFDSQRIDGIDISGSNPVAVTLKQQSATPAIDMAPPRER